MILSYAQNMEDHTLAGVFAGDAATQDGGVYVDIGGGHAVADNVTFWLYLQGWRGVVVEPQLKLAAAYAGVRPRDVVLSQLVGRTVGVAAFHEVDKLHGFSTIVAEHAKAAAAFGTGYATRQLPMTTLAGLCEQQNLTRIDLLKIDVEGAEADVLAGNDWQRFRPRVLCIEAVAPGSMAEAWHEWEPELLTKGYAFAYFDGLNRFYVADEAAELKLRFPETGIDWGAATHLYDFGRPSAGARHADHALAKALCDGLLASLPMLEPALLAQLIAAGMAGQEVDLPRLMTGDAALVDMPKCALPAVEGDQMAQIMHLIATDAVRAALGRIACFHDGGHILED